MTTQTANAMTKWVAVAVVTLIALLALSWCSPKRVEGPTSADQQAGSPQRAEGDTNAETLRNLTSKMTSFEGSTNSLSTNLSAMTRRLNDLERRGSDQRQASPSTVPSAEALRAKDLEIADLKRQLQDRQSPQPLAVQGTPQSGLPIGMGLDSIANARIPIPETLVARPPKATTSTAGGGYITVSPLNAPSALTTAAGSVGAGAQRLASSVVAASNGATLPRTRARPPRGGSEQPRPVYTIPANATLVGSIGMTALIGRIPNSGTVQDPYPFKIITGAENLASNGIDIPGLEGMVWQGAAVGDWGLSCVRGTLESVTYTFKDGTIQTLNLRSAQQQSGQSSNRGGSSYSQALAWISDPYGSCVPGERISNAAGVLTARVATSAFEEAAKAYARSETSTLFNVAGGATQLLTGDALKYGGYSALAGGASDIRSWLDARLGQIFDAVYAPPGTAIVVHVNTEIPIDYNPSARKVSHVARTSNSRLD